jgi:MSHA biogenesis protein MshN
MLRDLDRRQSEDDRRIFGQHLRSNGARHIGLWIALGVAALAVAGGIGFMLRGIGMSTPVPAPQPVAVTAPAPVAAPEPVPAPALAVTAAPPAVETPAIGAVPVPPQPVAEPPKAVAAATVPAKAKARPATPPVREAAKAEKEVASPPPTFALSTAPLPAAVAVEQPAKIDKQFRDSPTRTADGEFRRAATLIETGRMTEATAALRSAIEMEPRHEGARQALVVVLLDAGALDEAERVLTEGLLLNPAQTNFALILARIKLERGDPAAALAVLQAHGAAAGGNPEYLAFAAALFQRLGRHDEAIAAYQAALKQVPNVGAWWIGLGISAEAANRPQDAAEAYQRAKTSGRLSADLTDFVDRKLQTVR